MKKILSIYLSILFTIILSNISVTFAQTAYTNVYDIEISTGDYSDVYQDLVLFDPSDRGDDDVLDFELISVYNQGIDLSDIDSAHIEIRNPDNLTIKTISMDANGDFDSWDGEYLSDIVKPGDYSIVFELNSAIATVPDSYETTTLRVDYGAGSPEVDDFDLDPSSFNPGDEDSIISFRNIEEADITVEIADSDGDIVRRFDDYDFGDDFYYDGDFHSIIWDGYTSSGYSLSKGTYYVQITLINDYGVDFAEKSIYLSSTSSSSDYNSHIDNLRVTPSTFEPDSDDEIVIRFDIRKDLDKLEIFAVRGDEEIDILREYDIEKDDDFTEYWDAQDDDGDFVENGAWRIEVRTEIDDDDYELSKTVYVEYDTPEIDELLVSKKTFDNEEDEFTYVLFKLSDDALVDLEVLVNSRLEDEIEEEMDVEADTWYAVYFDGDDYDYDDDIDIRLKAYSPYTDSEYTSKKVSVNLSEDYNSSSRVNISEDYIEPVVSEGKDDYELHFYIEDDASVEVSIHKGSSGSGTRVIELLDVDDMDEGYHTISWDANDKYGKSLRDGIYTYKIVTTENGLSETETGQFVVGDSGDDYYVSDNSDDDDDVVASNVIIDGFYGNNADNFDTCAGFSDVNDNSKYCDAIIWAKSNGIIDGYQDNTFKPYSPINRAEFLKVVMETVFGVVTEDNYGNAGFYDIESGAWYVKYFKSASNIGVISGDAGKNTVRPSDYINRAESLKISLETIEYATDLNIKSCNYMPYTDIYTGLWYSDYICFSKLYNLLETSSNNFYASNLVTRGEMVELLYKLYLNDLL